MTERIQLGIKRQDANSSLRHTLVILRSLKMFVFQGIHLKALIKIKQKMMYEYYS